MGWRLGRRSSRGWDALRAAWHALRAAWHALRVTWHALSPRRRAWGLPNGGGGLQEQRTTPFAGGLVVIRKSNSPWCVGSNAPLPRHVAAETCACWTTVCRQHGGGEASMRGALIVSLLYKPDAQARESSKTVAHPSLARRACMSSLLAFHNVTIKAVEAPASGG